MKTITQIIDWKNSVVYVRYSDGSTGYAHASNINEALARRYRIERQIERSPFAVVTMQAA